MNFIKKHRLLLIFIFGLLIRLIFIFGPYAFDVNNHIVWAKDLHERGCIDFFFKQSSEVYGVKYPNYPPLALFIFYIFYPLPKIIFNFFWFLNNLVSIFPSNFITLLEGIDKRLFLAAMLKLPAILFDIGSAWIIYLFTKKFFLKKNLAFFSAFLILFNPAFIYNSSFWGQIDVIPLFFVIVSVYVLLFTKKHILSGILFTISLLVKPTTLVFFPIYSLMFIKKFGFKKSLLTLFFSNLLFWLSFLPFTKKLDLILPYLIYWQKIISAQSLPYVTNSAFNFWMIFFGLKNGTLDTAPFIFNISYRVWGYLLTGIFLSIVLFKLWKSEFKKEIFFLGLFLSSFASVIFLTKMHERYFLLTLPFLLILAFYKKDYLKYFYFLSAIAFLNQYYSWTIPYIPFIFKIINTFLVYRFLSLANIFIFLIFVKINLCKS